jgi:hypothetical protein
MGEWFNQGIFYTVLFVDDASEAQIEHMLPSLLIINSTLNSININRSLSMLYSEARGSTLNFSLSFMYMFRKISLWRYVRNHNFTRN